MFINELIWREFYLQVLWFNPDVLAHEYQEQYRDLAWRDHWRPETQAGSEEFQRWCRGETGFPIVDAGMRQLNATGFMHNRVRMITAMFLTKDLHTWWMHGESYFMQRLVEISPMNWGLEALLTVLLRGGGVADTLPQVGRLVLFAAAMFLLAVFLFRRPAS